MNENGHQRHHFEFADFRLYPVERLLVKANNRVAVTPRVLDLLIVLVEHQGELLGKELLLDKIWSESFVEEGNLSRAVSTLRKNLGAQQNGSDFIETVPRLGYRFIAPVVKAGGGPPEKSLVEKARVTQRPVLLAVAALTVMALVVLGAYLWRGDRPRAQNRAGEFRLTSGPQHETHAQWTTDDQIRFINFTDNKTADSWVMNTDGGNRRRANESIKNLRVGSWSSDGSRVLFLKEGDSKTVYMARADGTDEIRLPFAAGNNDWSPDGQKIVYQDKSTAADADIFVYSVDTGKIENISNNPAFEADPSFSPDGEHIVFVSSRDGNPEVYVMRSDGSEIVRLTQHLATEDHPVFSPDGTQIAFNSNRENENSDVYVVNLDGSNVRRLTDAPSNESVEPGCWSPDGTRIVFTSDRDGNDDIFITGAEVYKPVLIVADETAGLQYPSYSPDGRQIAFEARLPDKSGELRVFDIDSKQSRTLLKAEIADLQPAFSPKQNEIVFQNKVGSNTEICLIDTRGGEPADLTNDPARDASPAFSPDGSQIVFTSNRGRSYGEFNIFAMNRAGGGQHEIYADNLGVSISPAWAPNGAGILFANDKEDGRIGNFEIFRFGLDAGVPARRLTFRRRYDWQPAVSPDGHLIAYASNADGNSEIYLMDIDGSRPLRITRNPAADVSPRWSTDGRRIIFASDRDGKFAIYEISVLP